MVSISRARAVYRFPADFMLVAAMNPCKCGYYPDRNRCMCREKEVLQYQNRVSRPFLDRMDMAVHVEPVNYQQLSSREKGENSAAIRKRVETVHAIQRERYQKEMISYNSQLVPGQMERYCILGGAEKKYMEQVYQSLSLTARGYYRILKTARTIADLEESTEIKKRHLGEAVFLRQKQEVL